jgi:hypothetical protein
MIYINVFESGEVLVEDVQSGDEESIPLVNIDPNDLLALTAMVQLQSFNISRGLGALFAAGVELGRKRSSRLAAEPVPILLSISGI